MTRIFVRMAAMFATLLLMGCDESPQPGAAADSGVRTSTGDQAYWVEQLAGGLKFPSAIVWLPDGTTLITERQGDLYVMRDGKLDRTPVPGLPETYRLGLNGIKDMLPDPDFEETGTLYFSVSEGTYEQNHAAVYRARYTRQGLQRLERIFRSKDDVMGAGSGAARMYFLADKTLLVAVPENDSYKARAQQLSSHIGKVIRINRDGSVPADNPLRDTPGALPEIFSYGHRVTLGFHENRETGEILAVESGPSGGDELNLLEPGANYGWAKASWGFDYTGGLAAPTQSAPDIKDPILIWTPSVTPSGLTRYEGNRYPQWTGDYFVGQLTTKTLVRLRIRDNRVVLQEKMLLDLDERIRDVKAGPDGYIYILTDHQEGRVLRLQPGKPREDQLVRVARKLEHALDLEGNIPLPDLDPGDPGEGKQAFLQHCAACHAVGTLVKGGEIGPDLAGVFERNAGTHPGFSYSAAMANSPQVWNARTLNLFIGNPAQYLPGTKMASPPIVDAQTRRNIVGFLKAASPE